MILITDAHISKSKGNHDVFFKMLESLEKNSQDLIFLGDIFDLWISLPRYEEDIHREFTAWCREQKKHRTVGYLEGNHEFYLAAERGANFTWCSQNPWQEDSTGILFAHGDQINRKDKHYLGFRKLTKNKISKFIMNHMPFGPQFAQQVKKESKKTNARFRMHLPVAEIEHFAEARFAEGINRIFVGHFHGEYIYRNRDLKELHILPDWFSTQKVAIYHRNLKEIRYIHWEEL